MSHDPKDDVDRLFACFKCGISPPKSALKDRAHGPMKSKKGSEGKGEPSASTGVATPSISRPQQHSSPDAEKSGGSASMAIKFKSGKQISPMIFYGSPHGAPVKRPSQLLRLLHEIRVDLREQDDLTPRKDIWATFPRQEEAMRFVKTQAHAKIFSYQDHLSGQRRFLVSTYEEFWRRYKNMDSIVRHHYEVIQEGLPCHLYFDLEFNKKANTNRDVDEMVDIFTSVTLKTLFEKYHIKGNEEWVIELDSSTEVLNSWRAHMDFYLSTVKLTVSMWILIEKFSRHLIIHIPRTAFKDNSHIGAFVSEVCSRIINLQGSDPQIEKLYIIRDPSSPDSSRQLFLDTAVYSRNRCFRLVFSSKAGKSSVLLPTGRFKCKNMNDKQVFMESLICKMDADCDKLLTCKLDLDCKKTLCFDSEVHEQNCHIPQDLAPNACRTMPSTHFSEKSPFPALDAFVVAIASSGNVPGKIRCWYWFSVDGLMVYSMSRNRYCERIGREHKSNHVMYIVDFRRAGYYQKCYDPDCKGYRSPLRPLPWDVIPDQTALFNSIQAENYSKTVNISFDLQSDKSNMEGYLCDDGKWVTESCKKESSWWQEAMRYADCIENMVREPEFSKLEWDIDDDCRWWSDAEKIMSQVEEYGEPV